MRRTCVLLLLIGLVGLLAAGCVRLLEPRPSNTRYYLLGSHLATDTTANTATDGLRIGLRKPRLAEYLDTPTLAVRRGPNEVNFSEFHRWGEDLGVSLNRVVALNLERQPGIQSTEVVPWPRGTSFDYVVQLHILRFEGVGPAPPGPDADGDTPPPRGHSQTTVAWTVLTPDSDDVIARGWTRDRRGDWPVTDHADLVAKLDASLVVLAEDIGRRLRALADSPS
jgi:uncharacterized lipoprotein YmbA